MSEKQVVTFRVEDRIAWVNFARPEKRNAMSPTLNRRMMEVLDELEYRDDVGVLVLGGEGAGWVAMESLLDRAAVLFAWEQVGLADAALEQARDYAMGRYAFGRSIASYQAIKHKLAGMYVKNTLARSNCYYGAWALDSGSSELALAAATARVGSIQASVHAAEENVQTHGGMGFTWEFDCQFYYRRAKLLSVNIGSEGYWQDRLITAYEQNNAA